MPKGKSDAITGYDYENLMGMPHSQVSNSGFQSATALSKGKYLQRGSNPYTDYLHPELSMRNPVGGYRGGPVAIGSIMGPDGHFRQIGGKGIGSAFKKVGKALQGPAEAVATQYLVNALTNPAVDEGLMEGAEVGMMAAAGRRRGRPPAGGKFSLKKAVSHPVTKTIIKKATPIVQKQGEKMLKKGIDSLVSSMMQDEQQGMSGGRKLSIKKIASHPITKKIADHVIKTATPIVKDYAKKTIKEALSGSSEPAGGKISMGKIGKSIGKEVGKSALRVGTDVGEQMLASYLAGEGRGDKVRQAIDDIEDLGSDIKRMYQRRRGGAQSGGKGVFKTQSFHEMGRDLKGGARHERAQIVKQVMAERGCSLPQASRIVKEEGLYGGGMGGDPKHSPLGRFL